MMPQAWFGPAGREPNPPLDEAPGLPRPRTALPVVEGVPRHLEAHLARLEAGARHLGQRVDWLPTAGTALCRWLQTCVQPRHAALRLRLVEEVPCFCEVARLQRLQTAVVGGHGPGYSGQTVRIVVEK